MTILITGAAGYIGSHTCVELLNAGYDLVGIDNFYNSKRSVIPTITSITGKEFPFYEMDLCDYNTLDQVFRQHHIDGIIHFAGYKSVPESVAEPVRYYENNLLSTMNLMKCMKAYHVTKIIFSSSATVYGKEDPVPYTEDMLLSPCNPYGQTKVIIEQMLTDYAHSDTNVHVALLRYFNPIGAHSSGLLGDDPNGVALNLMPNLCKAAHGDLEYLKLCGTDYATEDGTCIRDYIHITDLALGHLKTLEKLSDAGPVSIYNLGTGHGTSVLEMIHTFEDVCHVKVPYKTTQRRPGDLDCCYADCSKAEKELGWTSTHTLADMCRDSWHFTTCHHE